MADENLTTGGVIEALMALGPALRRNDIDRKAANRLIKAAGRLNRELRARLRVSGEDDVTHEARLNRMSAAITEFRDARRALEGLDAAAPGLIVAAEDLNASNDE